LNRALLAIAAAACGVLLAAAPTRAEMLVAGAFRPTTVTCVNPTTNLLESCSGGGGGGGGSSATANAADPTRTEGDTAAALSVDLTGYLRAKTKAALNAYADGWNVTLGAQADSACGTDNGTCTEMALLKRTNQRITSLITALGSPIQTTGGQVTGYAAMVLTSVTRPANTTAYTANDAWSDSTSAPTSGGFTLANACRVSGGSGIITSVTIVSSIDPTTALQGEIWLFDSAFTNINDNAAWAMSDSDMLLMVAGGVIPFTLASNVAGATSGTSSFYTQGGLGIGFTCVGSANLRFGIKVKNAYTPASGEVLSVRLNIVQTN